MGTQDEGGGGAGSEERETGSGARTSGTSEGSRACILPFSKRRGVRVRRWDEESSAITASTSRGGGGGKGEAEKRGVGGMSMGSGVDRITSGGVGKIKLRKPSMAVSRPRDRTVATSGVDATQRAIEDAKSVLKAVGKGSSEMLASRRETLLLSMPSVEMLRGIEGAGDGEGGINGLVKG